MTPPSSRPWKRVRSTREQDYTVLKIREDYFLHPRDGKEHPRVVMEVADWVNVVAVTTDGHAILVRQFRPGINASTLEAPGGIIDPGEEPIVAAARELEEETGFRAATLRPLGFTHPNPAWQNNRAFSFLAEGCVKIHEGHQDTGEDISVELHPLEDIPELFRRGDITHAIVAGAFFLARLHGVG